MLFFNSAKCKVLHIDLNHPKYEYKRNDRNSSEVIIKSVDSEKYLGVIFKKILSLSNILILL